MQNDTNRYVPEGLPVELDLSRRVLRQKGEDSPQQRFTPMEFPLLSALLRSYPTPGYITANDAERAVGSSLEHIQEIIVRNMNIKLVPFRLTITELPGNIFTLQALSEGNEK